MEYKAVIPIVSGIAVSMPDFRPEPIRVLVDPGTEPWVPDSAWWAALSAKVPPGQTVHFQHRPAANKYRYRAVNNGSKTTIYVDGTETPESVKWLLLHEMTHATINRCTEAARIIRSQPKPKDYATNDEAHASVWEEQIANACADYLAPSMETYPGLDRFWWRTRVNTLQPNSMHNYGTVSLPSAQAAGAFVRGLPGGFAGVVSTYLQRSAFLTLGLYALGSHRKNLKVAARNGFTASAVIEAFVLYEAWKQTRSAPPGA
jgi:hypothetical protein